MITEQKGVQIVNGAVEAAKTYFGLSTDTKPNTAANGACFIEMDTGKIYFYDMTGTQWIEWGA